MLAPVAVALLFAAALLLVGGIVLARRSGARTSFARRLAGARQVAVGDLASGTVTPDRPVRVLGRVRCPDPIRGERDERLVALHRDVEILTADGAWRAVERVRESRGFELWDHAGSLSVDAALVAEPIVSIPYVWEGDPAVLDESFRPAIARLVEEHGPARAARATTRTISVIDRLLVLSAVVRDAAGRARLSPPPGGYLVSSLELPDAMRLLGGPHRGRLLVGAALIAAAFAASVAGLLMLAAAGVSGT